MALKVWLPLNGNLNNQGLSDIQIVNNGAAIDSSGKIGSCYSFDGTDDYISLSNLNFMPEMLPKEWTICFWVYNNDGGDRSIYFSNYQIGGVGDASFGFEKTTGELLRIVYNSGKFDNTVGACSIDIGKWTHLAISKDVNHLVSVYKNGNFIASYTNSNCASNGTLYYLGRDNRTGATALKGKLNDFRIYDECLSQKQIKEISKGLVAHYKLDNPRALNNLKRNSAYGTYNNFASSGSTCTVVDTGTTYQGAKIYRMTYTPNETSLSSVQTSLHSHGVTTPSYTFTAGTKYCYWTLCKPISHPDTIVGGVASNIGYWYEIPMKEYGNGWYIVGQKRTGNAPENKSDIIFTSFKTPSATNGTPIIIDFCCPHLVEGYDEIIPEFDYAGTTVTQERDVSGNGYSGTINGTLTYNNDSPRYEGCTKFDANTSYIKLPALTTGGFANSFTIIYWANIANMNGKMAWGFSDGNRLNIYPTGSVICCNTGDGANNPYQNNGSSITYSQWNNGWHQFAMVADGSTNKLYVDGQLQGTAKTYKGITGTQMYISGWDTGTSYRWVNGSISDFRIYSTALTADDILTLYKTSGIIDNKGNTYTYEFKEE